MAAKKGPNGIENRKKNPAITTVSPVFAPALIPAVDSELKTNGGPLHEPLIILNIPMMTKSNLPFGIEPSDGSNPANVERPLEVPKRLRI